MTFPLKSAVTAVLNGQQHNFTVEPELETILQAGLDKQVDLPYSCMGGACATCRARLMEGTVKMDCNLILSDEELAQGYVLTCQSRPTSEKIIVNYDL